MGGVPGHLIQLTLDKGGETTYMDYEDTTGTKVRGECTGSWVIKDGDVVVSLDFYGSGTPQEFLYTLDEDALGNPALTLRGSYAGEALRTLSRDKDFVLDGASDAGE